MQSLNKNQKREQLAFLTALTLLFSYIEMILPRFVPFFRLGLANVVILLSLELYFGLFFLLALLKAVASLFNLSQNEAIQVINTVDRLKKERSNRE